MSEPPKKHEPGVESRREGRELAKTPARDTVETAGVRRRLAELGQGLKRKLKRATDRGAEPGLAPHSAIFSAVSGLLADDDQDLAGPQVVPELEPQMAALVQSATHLEGADEILSVFVGVADQFVGTSIWKQAMSQHLQLLNEVLKHVRQVLAESRLAERVTIMGGTLSHLARERREYSGGWVGKKDESAEGNLSRSDETFEGSSRIQKMLAYSEELQELAKLARQVLVDRSRSVPDKNPETEPSG